jgi:hypothetical protein
MRKSKKLVIYEEKSTGNYFIRATTVSPKGIFVIKPAIYGVAKSRNITNEELGKYVREILNNCD